MSDPAGGSAVIELGPLYITDYELPEWESTPGAPIGPEKHIAEETTEWLAVCSYLDYCMVGDKTVPFDSCASLDQQVLASPDVKARGNCVYRQGDMFKGVLGDAGAHVVSETSLGDGHVLILEGHNKVKVNNIPVACHDGPCMINTNAMGMGGTPGRLLTEISIPGTSSVPTGPSSSARLEQLKGLQEKLGRGQFDLDKLDEYVQFGELNDIIDGIQGTEGAWTDYLAQGTRGVLKFGTGIGEGAYELVKLGGKLAQRSTLQNLVDGAILAEEIRLGNVTAGSVGSQALETGKAIIVPPEAQEAWQKGATTEAVVHTALNVGTLVGGLAKSAGGLLRRAPKVEPIPPKVPEPPPPVALPEPVSPKVELPPTQGVKVKRTAAEGGKYGEEVAHARMKELGYERIDKGGDYVHGRTGIDGVYRNPSPPPDYVIMEAKYNTAGLDKIKDGTRQMSDDWIDKRLNDAVGKRQADIIRGGLNDGSVLRVVVKVSEDGKAVGSLVNKDGYVIRGKEGNWPLQGDIK